MEETKLTRLRHKSDNAFKRQKRPKITKEKIDKLRATITKRYITKSVSFLFIQ